MLIGIPKEVKEFEFRVGATPAMIRSFVESGHQVMVQTHAGDQIGFSDALYKESGAQIVTSAKEVWTADMIIKVKEPQTAEFPLMHEGQILFCYLHLAPDPIQTRNLLDRKVIGIAYETVTDAAGRLPLLVPMSEIAGRLAIQVGAVYLQMNKGGKGLLLGGVPGVLPANVIVLGGGVVGTEAARMALGLGAHVTILDKNIDRLRTLDAMYGPNLRTLYSTTLEIEHILKTADLVIGAVLIPGKTAPRLVTRNMLKGMEPGSVIVDVAIDQGGCTETSRPTTHGNPTYVEEGVMHYCVTNMPGAVARSSTLALTNATMDYALKIANLGYQRALAENHGLRNGLNVWMGEVTNHSVAHDLNYTYVPPEEVLA